MENASHSYALNIKTSSGQSYQDALAKLYLSEFTGIEEKPQEIVFHYAQESEMLEALDSISSNAESLQIKTNSIEDQNWNALWESQYPDVVIGSICQIRAEFHEINKKVQNSILISPKMSFGTGHHPTTALMIEGMAKIDLEGKSVLDLGTGTGVLAILAEMRGAKEIVGVEILPHALENAKENGMLNKSNVEWVLGEISDLDEGTFDIVLANINKNAIVSISASLVSKCAKGGNLLLSGFYERDIAELRSVFENLGMEYSYQKSEQEWSLLVLKR